MRPESPKRIVCSSHGEQPLTMICRHLTEGERQGFHQDNDPDTLLQDAWCDRCERDRRTGRGWKDDPVGSRFLLVCSVCYLDIRARHWPAGSKERLTKLVDAATGVADLLNAEVDERHALNETDRFHWNFDSAQILFHGGESTPIIAEFCLVGSYSLTGRSWLWSWANDAWADHPQLTAPTHEVRAFGEELDILELACGFWLADEDAGRQMMAVAAQLLGAEGTFCTREESTVYYLVLSGYRPASRDDQTRVLDFSPT